MKLLTQVAVIIAVSASLTTCGGDTGSATDVARVSIDPSLEGIVELSSSPILTPGGVNHLEASFDLTNRTASEQRLRCAVGWLDERGNRRGGQTQELTLFANQQLTVRSPTNDRQVARYSLALTPLAPAGEQLDPNTLWLFASDAEQTGLGTVSVFIEQPDEAVVYAFVIDEPGCGPFRFSPGKRCRTEPELQPGGSTRSIMVSFDPQGRSKRKGTLIVDFEDPSREDIRVPLSGRVGSGDKGSVRLRI